MTETRLVYSTAASKHCPHCGKPLRKCNCQQSRTPAGQSADGIVRIRRESKGRAGKEVTVISGMAMDTQTLKAQAKSLKAACGSGGSIKNGEIEIQGDHREKIKKLLEKQGLDCRLAGG